MATPYTATLEGKYSDIVLGRVIPGGDTGWNFEEAQIAFPAEDEVLVPGTVYKVDGTALATTDAATAAYGVLVDRKTLPGVFQFSGTVAEDTLIPYVLAVRGCTFNFYKLKFADGTQITDAVAQALSAAGANQVNKHIVGTEFIGSVL